MHELGVHASDEKGQDLTSKVMMNLTQVDVNKAEIPCDVKCNG